MRRLIHKILRGLPWATFSLGVLGVLMRLLVRDWVPILAVVYYLMPWLIIGICFSASAFLFGKGRLSRLSLVLAVLCFALWLPATFEGPKGDRPVSQGDVVRVVFWNAQGRMLDKQRLRELKAAKPDIMVIAECGFVPRSQRKFLRNWDGHAQYRRGERVFVWSKSPVALEKVWHYDHLDRFLEFRTSYRGQAIRLVAVDVYSRPTRFRKRPLMHAAVVANGEDGGLPTLVMGDFNTPNDSVWWRNLRRGFEHAFEERGRGLNTTWPEPVPLLQIDHFWAERGRFRVLQAQQIDTGCSDHRLLIVDVDICE